MPTGTPRHKGSERREGKGVKIVKLWLSGWDFEQIAKRLHTDSSYVNAVVYKEQQLLQQYGAPEYLSILLQKVHAILGNHSHSSKLLVWELCHIEDLLASNETVVSECKETIKTHLIAVKDAGGLKDKLGRTRKMAQASQDKVAGARDSLAELEKVRMQLRKQVVELTKAINGNNSALVDSLVRMGVSTIAASVNKESHTPLSTDDKNLLEFAGKDVSEIRGMIEESTRRKLKYLRDVAREKDLEVKEVS
jgi:hypothetical protein